jgi:hypothetical protein
MTIEQRLQKLERQNRFWKVGALCLATMLLMGATGSVNCSSTIRSQKFELIDACGQVRAELTMENDLPALVFVRSNGARNNRVGLVRNNVNGEGAELSLWNPNGTCGVDVRAFEHTASILLNGGNNRRINLRSRSDNTAKPHIWLQDETGLRARIDTEPDQSRLQLNNTQGAPTFTAP